MEIIAIAVSAIIGLLVTYLQWSFKAAVIDRIDKLALSVEEIKKDFTGFREKVIGEYATNGSVNEVRSENKAAHTELWKALNDPGGIRDRITKIETKLEK